MEALKPLVVLALFGMILYGAYTVVNKGPTPAATDAVAAGGDAPPFLPPDVSVPPAAPTPAAAVPTAAVPAPVPAAAAPVAAAPAQSDMPAAVDAPPEQPPTYLSAESAPPPAGVTPAPAEEPRPGDLAADTAAPPLAASPPPTLVTPASIAAPPAADPGPPPSSAAFASAWTDAHEKLAAGRYAEALSALSVWYDDPALGLEESQRLEDLLGQLAGTVIYSQQDLLVPPHVVAATDTLPAIAAPLGVTWQLLAKINGIEDPARLVAGEHLKLVRGPFDAVVSISRRRVSLQLAGAYAGSFPAVVGRQFLDRVGGSLPVVEVRRASEGAAQPAIALGDGLTIEAVDDPAAVADATPQASLVVATRDLVELADILGPGSRVLVRQ